MLRRTGSVFVGVALVSIVFAGCRGSDAAGSRPADGGGSTDTADPGDSADTNDTAADSGDSADSADSGLDWGGGPHAITGQAYFFDMPSPPSIVQVTDVEGALVYVFEAPELRATLSADDEHRFRIEGIPDGARVTLALSHPDYFPHLTGTWTVDEAELEGLTFQAVTTTIAGLAAGLLGVDVADDSRCQMSTTVTVAGADSVWAAGEPDATVSLTPTVPALQGPYYFNTSVIPDPSLVATTTDGGVLVVGADPGEYTWNGHKEGVEFAPVTLRCEGGWLTNASPPWGLNARSGR